jgi:hypothetical protein
MVCGLRVLIEEKVKQLHIARHKLVFHQNCWQAVAANVGLMQQHQSDHCLVTVKPLATALLLHSPSNCSQQH